MIPKEKKILADAIELDGFEAITKWDIYEEIKDPEFHQLLKQYNAARRALANYVGRQTGYHL